MKGEWNEWMVLEMRLMTQLGNWRMGDWIG